MRPPISIEIAKARKTAKQRTFRTFPIRLLPATPPQLLDAGIKKNRCQPGFFDKPRILCLHKCAAAESHNFLRPGPHLAQHLLQRGMFGDAKGCFTGLPKNLVDPAPFTSFDSLVQIFKSPTKPLGEATPNAALTRAHEAQEKDRPWLVSSFARTRHAAARTTSSPPAQISFSLGFSYCFSERLLRWILPLKVRRITVEETATRPTVPAKARPLSSGNQV